MSRPAALDRMLVVIAVIAIAVLAGLATHPSGGSAGTQAPVALVVVLVQTLLWLVIAADVLVTALIIHALISERRSFVTGGRRRSLLVYLAALVPAGITAVAILFLPPGTLARLPTLAALLAGPGGRVPNAHRVATASTGGADVLWISLLLAALIIVTFLGWFFWGGTKRPNPRERAATPPPDAVVAAIEESMDALRGIADPRRAIIAAYSAMERSLSRAGMSRRPADAPTEFLARVLRSAIDVSIEATRLTYLFEVAKFSDHGVDESMRADALGALARIREQVAAATPT